MPDGTQTVQSLAALIKQQYPTYAQMDDHELVSKVIQTYPTYQNQLSTAELQRLASGGGATQGPGTRFMTNLNANLGAPEKPADVATGPAYAAMHPVESSKLVGGGIKDAMGRTVMEGEAQMGQPGISNKVQGAYKYVMGHIPMVGPGLVEAGKQYQAGDIAGGTGSTAGLGIGLALGKYVEHLSGGLPENYGQVIEHGAGSSIPHEIPKEQLTRNTPLTDTAKPSEPGGAISASSTAVGATTKASASPAGSGGQPGLSQASLDWLEARRAKAVQPSPPMGAATLPESQPVAEARMAIKAAEVEKQPNPTVPRGTDAQIAHAMDIANKATQAGDLARAEKAKSIAQGLLDERNQVNDQVNIGIVDRMASRSRETIANTPTASTGDQAQALRVDNQRLADALNSGRGNAEERTQANARIEQNTQMISELEQTKPVLSTQKTPLELAKPVYPGKEATLDQLRKYASDRDDFMAQEAKKRPAAPQPTDPHEIVDKAINRVVKTDKTVGGFQGRLNELDATVRQHGDSLNPDQVRQPVAQLQAQADELRRVAAAPEKIALMADQKGGKLFGDWQRTGVSSEEAAAIKKAGDQPPRPGWIDLSGKSPGERDFFHELLGHNTAEVLTRDESGQPVQIQVKGPETAQFVEQKRAELASMVEKFRGGDMPPSAEELEHAATLKDLIEQYSGLRDKLTATGPRKGQPVVDAQGVVRAPGAIPDIGQKTGNALVDRPQSSHFAKPSPEKLLARADRLDTEIALRNMVADGLEKHRAGSAEVRVDTSSLTEKPAAVKVPEVPKTEPKPAQTSAQLETTNEIARLEKQLKATKSVAERQRLQDTIAAYKKAAYPAPVSEQMNQTAQRLFGKESWNLLTQEEQLKGQMSISGLEAKLPKPEGSPYDPGTAPFHQGFPMGPVTDTVRNAVSGLHDMAIRENPEAANRLADVVRNQGLATREAAFKLYGRALTALMENRGPEAFSKALDVANRNSEHGALRASFLTDIIKDLHDRAVPGRIESDLDATKQTIREAGARAFQYTLRVSKQLGEVDKFFKKMPQLDQWQFQKDLQSGDWRSKYAQNAREFKAAQLLRDVLDVNRQRIQAAHPGALEEFDDNYFPQRWEGIHDLNEYVARVGGGRANLNKANFLRDKYYGSLQAGEDAGLRPAEYNPARAVVNLVAESSHYIKGQEILSYLRDNNLIKNFASPRDVEFGYEQLNPKVSRNIYPVTTETGRTAMALGHGGVYAPADIAKMFNNYFNPGIFQDHPGLDTIRIYNQAAQIGAVSLSGYHVGLTSMESFVTDLSLGLKYMVSGAAQGRLDLMGKGALSFARSAISIPEGIGSRKLGLGGGGVLEKYEHAGLPGYGMDPVVKGMIEGGYRSGISSAFDTEAMSSIRKNVGRAVRAQDYLGAFNEGARALPAAVRTLSGPVQDFWVKRMKAMATYKMVEFEMDRLGPGASDAERKAALRNAVDSADNRFGQMVVDNLFWNRTTRDVMSLGFKFVDFNYGSIRELYGGAKDVGQAAVGSGLSHRLAHNIAFAGGVAMGGAILQYMLTGKGPSESKDYYFPKDGTTGSDGKPGRVMLPTYLRSYVEMAQPAIDLAQGDIQKSVSDASKVAEGRLSPAVMLINSLRTNRDFLGNQIQNPNDPVLQRMGSVLGAVVRQSMPISSSAWDRAQEQGKGTRGGVLAVAGVQSVPRSLGIDRTPAEQELEGQLRETHGGGYAAPETLAHERAINKLIAADKNDTGQFDKIWNEEYAKGNVKSSDIHTIMTRESKPYMDRIKELGVARQVDVLEKGDANERAQMIGKIKFRELIKMADQDKAQKLSDRINRAMEKPN